MQFLFDWINWKESNNCFVATFLHDPRPSKQALGRQEPCFHPTAQGLGLIMNDHGRTFRLRTFLDVSTDHILDFRRRCWRRQYGFSTDGVAWRSRGKRPARLCLPPRQVHPCSIYCIAIMLITSEIKLEVLTTLDLASNVLVYCFWT